LILSGVAVIVSVLKAPRFPINDPALFEYFGRSILHGEQLYGATLSDIKLPSIYLVNVLWQFLFGSNYFLHTCAAALVNLASIALFALTLRKFGVRAWALGTFLFAAFFTLPFPQFDYAQHYAAFFIVLGVWLAASERFVLAGLSLAVATTFWLPAALTCIPLLLQPLRRQQRVALVAGLFGVTAVLVLATLVAFGRSIVGFIFVWMSYLHAIDVPVARLRETLLDSALGSSILAMLAMLAVVVRRPATRAERFALIWSGCMLAGFAIPPRFSEHYLLPAVPALAMAIAAYDPSLIAARRRALVALVALGLLVFAARNSIRHGQHVDAYAAYAQRIGHWIGANLGVGAVIYTFEFVPEVLLAADGVSPGRTYEQDGNFARERIPDVLVFGPYNPPDVARRHLDITARRQSVTVTYVPVCAGRTGELIVYVVSSKAGVFACRPKPKSSGTPQ